MTYLNLNLLASACLACTALGTYLATYSSEKFRPYSGFSLFWGILFLLSTVGYLLIGEPGFLPRHSHVVIALDVFANASLFLAAYCLYEKKTINLADQNFVIALVSSLVLAIWALVIGHLFKSNSLLWQSFFNSPSSIFASVAFVYVGVAVFKCKAIEAVRWPIVITVLFYALLQAPAYLAFFTDIPSLNNELATARHILTPLLAVGKIAFLFAYISAIVAFRTDGPNEATKIASQVKLGLTILNIGLLVAVGYHRWEVLKHIVDSMPKNLAMAVQTAQG